MAFEDGLGHDPSQPIDYDYVLSATGLVSRTISLWSQKLLQYIIIVGVIGAACATISFVLLLVLFDTIDVLSADPISLLLRFFFDTTIDLPFISVSLGFAIFAFLLNAIIGGAAIKFTLDEYGENRGDIGTSFSHSFGRLLNIIVIQVIFSFLAAIVITPAMVQTTRAMEMIDISDPFNPIIPPGAIELLMSALGFLIVGGIFLIYIQSRFAPTLAIVIGTDLSAIDSLKKSWEITSGNVLHVLGGLILLNLAVIVLGLIVDVGLAFTYWPNSIILVIESVITALLFSSLTYIFTTVLYRDLVSRRGTSDLPDFIM